jgi:hypothetical protein
MGMNPKFNWHFKKGNQNMKYVADDGKEFDSEKACKIYENLYKKKSEPVVTKVSSVIVNVEMSDGLSHSIIYQNINKDSGEINMERILPDSPFGRMDLCKATINFDYLSGSMVII